jgi:hypothetical protein
MTTNQPRPRLKSLTPTPDQPSTAEPAQALTGRSAPKVAGRQAVLSALLLDLHTAPRPTLTERRNAP